MSMFETRDWYISNGGGAGGISCLNNESVNNIKFSEPPKINMKFFVVAFLLIGFAAVTLSAPTEAESLEPVKAESSPQETPVVPRAKRGLLFGAPYTAPVAYTGAYAAPVAYTSPYTYPYAYAYSGYPYYASAYSAPYYLA
ncbi:uncharacterized protein LOC135160860 [Diachasmimorpha longicaudata]|uniref:uncharacterized protein LOC135160860 n=1 Tax=Diachasmimorpha longicaudata TaxID=58733 RepID=UPI0030B894E3